MLVLDLGVLETAYIARNKKVYSIWISLVVFLKQFC